MSDWKYFLITIERDNKKETILCSGTSLLNFTLVEIDMGRPPVILWSQELTKEEYDYAQTYYSKLRKEN